MGRPGTRALTAPAAAALLVVTGAQPVDGAGNAPPGSASDPASWGDRRLASSLVLAGLQLPALTGAEQMARRGLGGIVVYGSPDRGFRTDLARIRHAAPGGRFLVASDEEGGRVQRLRSLLGPLPPARTVASTRTPRQARKLSRSYGRGMRRLGVNVALAPIADLAVPGSFIARDSRAFSRRPRVVSRYVTAAARGLQEADVLSMVKHWPGHGSAADTHDSPARTLPWRVLLERDVTPFRVAFARGVQSVMVGHLIVPGLTRGLPATMSPRALTRLRRQAGPDVLIMTDSLSMPTVTSAMGQSPTRAAVRALTAGADVVMVQSSPWPVVRGVRDAIRSGRIPRAQAVASARRVVAVQRRY